MRRANRKGDVNWWFVMLIVALAFGLLAFFRIDDVNASFRRVGESIQCSVPGGLYGECLGSSSCDGREGWKSYGAQRCPDEQPVCCILDEPKAWFTEGSVIVNALAQDYRLYTPDELTSGRAQQVIPPLKLKQHFSIIYVPKKGDVTCQVSIEGSSQSESFKEVGSSTGKTCYDSASSSWPVPRAVTLWDGTGKELLDITNMPLDTSKGGLTIGITVTPGSTSQRYEKVLFITN